MAVAKRKPAPVDLGLVDRIARARAANPPRSTENYVRARDLADALKLDVNDILDHWEERASIIEYDGNTPRADAERAAWTETLAHYDRQQVIL